MLKREDSNKILKTVKVILFATSLSLLEPVAVNAEEINKIEIKENTDFENIVFYTSLGMVTLIGSSLYYKLTKDMKNQPFIEHKNIKIKNNTKKTK